MKFYLIKTYMYVEGKHNKKVKQLVNCNISVVSTIL